LRCNFEFSVWMYDEERKKASLLFFGFVLTFLGCWGLRGFRVLGFTFVWIVNQKSIRRRRQRGWSFMWRRRRTGRATPCDCSAIKVRTQSLNPKP
jgi:hypothetical protein